MPHMSPNDCLTLFPDQVINPRPDSLPQMQWETKKELLAENS